MTLGRLTDAVADARQSITYADQSGDAFQRMAERTAGWLRGVKPGFLFFAVALRCQGGVPGGFAVSSLVFCFSEWLRVVKVEFRVAPGDCSPASSHGSRRADFPRRDRHCMDPLRDRADFGPLGLWPRNIRGGETSIAAICQ